MTRAGLVPSLWLALVGLAACSGDDAPTTVDAGADATTDADVAFDAPALTAPTLPTAPEAPAAPRAAPCPTGFRQVSTPPDPAVCEPWPAGGQQPCAPGEAHFAGEPGCRAVGEPCPEGPFPANLPPGRPVLFVAPGGSGDGTEEAPLGSPSEAAALATPGTVIAVAKGSYAGSVALTEGVALIGACAAETRISSDEVDDEAGTVEAAGAGVEVENLTLGPSRRPGLLVADAATARVRGLYIDGTARAGIFVKGSLHATEVVSRKGVPGSNREDGIAMYVAPGAEATVDRADFAWNRWAGVFVDEGATATLRFAAIHDTYQQATGQALGAGLLSAGHTSLEAVVIERCQFSGALMVAGARSDVSHLVIRDVAPEHGTGAGGGGMVVSDRARMEGRSILVERVHGEGLTSVAGVLDLADVVVRDMLTTETGDGSGVCVGASASEVTLERAHLARCVTLGAYAGANAEVALRDVSVHQVATNPFSGHDGVGLFAVGEASYQLQRVRVSAAHTFGVFANGAHVSGSDLEVRGTLPNLANGMEATGLAAWDGAQVELERAAFRQGFSSGIWAIGEGTLLQVRDLAVQDVRSRRSTGEYGNGVMAQVGVIVDLERALVERTQWMGLLLDDIEDAKLVDLTVQDTTSQGRDGALGAGIWVQGGTHGQVTRAQLAHNLHSAVHVSQEAQLAMTDVQIDEVGSQGCYPVECPEHRFGVGVGVYGNAGATIDGFRVNDASLCGVQIAEDASLTLTRGTVQGSPVGACIQAEGYDSEQLGRDVRYLDNGINLDATDLPLPKPVLGPTRD